jgi:hypothetical protein
VFVLCPSHRDHFLGVSIYSGSGYETPLGVVPIDQERVEQMVQFAPDIIHKTVMGHREEHAIEVELPFLQHVLTPPWQLVPIVMLDRSPLLCIQLAHAILAASEGISALIVASSDLYHGTSYTDCQKMDQDTLQAVEQFDAVNFLNGLETQAYQACGGGPITVAMIAARQAGAETARILAHSTSGDVTGQYEGYTVGYGTLAFYQPAIDDTSPATLTATEQQKLLDIARTAVDRAVNNSPFEPPASEEVFSGRLADQNGVFVTLKHHGILRGCIGQIDTTMPLYQTVSQVSMAAAQRDPRFPPIMPVELDALTISISILGSMKPLKHTDDLDIGIHGLYIEQGNTSGLLLPQVARDRKWDRKTFLEQTCIKAGLDGEAWQAPDTEIMYFTTETIGE